MIFGMFTFSISAVDTMIPERSIQHTITFNMGIPISSMNIHSSPTVICFGWYFGPVGVLPIRYIVSISSSSVTGTDIRYTCSVIISCPIFVFVTDFVLRTYHSRYSMRTLRVPHSIQVLLPLGTMWVETKMVLCISTHRYPLPLLYNTEWYITSPRRLRYIVPIGIFFFFVLIFCYYPF